MAPPSSNPLNVPHYPQVDDGYCLPACVQMVLAYLGLPSTQDRLARELDVRPPLGAPASNVIRLRSDVLDVTFTSGSLNDLRAHLTQGHPPIVFVQAGEFPHWHDRIAQHAVWAWTSKPCRSWILRPVHPRSPYPLVISYWPGASWTISTHFSSARSAADSSGSPDL